MLMIDIMTVIQVGFLIRMLILSHQYMKVNDWIKCANAVFGLSSYSGKHSCLWCEGPSSLEKGTIRTLGSLDYWYSQYAENGSIKKDMKNYMNVINPRILYYEENPDTVLEQQIPPPELHILIGFV